METKKSFSTGNSIVPRRNASDDLESGKSLRADAKRNKARVLEAAHAVFAIEGLSVPIEEIAKRAGVGVGTIYRHFPNKEDLFKAVVQSHKQRLVDAAKSLLDHTDPGEAFFRYFSQILSEGVTNKAFTEALINTDFEISCVNSDITLEVHHLFRELLTRAQQSGAVRDDVSVTELVVLMVGILHALENIKHNTGLSDHIISVVFDGLRRT